MAMVLWGERSRSGVGRSLGDEPEAALVRRARWERRAGDAVELVQAAEEDRLGVVGVDEAVVGPLHLVGLHRLGDEGRDDDHEFGLAALVGASGTACPGSAGFSRPGR